VFEHADITTLTDLCNVKLGANNGLSPYELSLFFTIFVMLQFWNMFNARAFESGASAFNLKDCSGFGMIAAVIIVGQVFIVSFGGEMFNVTHLKLVDWVIIIASTSLVLWIGEIARLFSKKTDIDSVKIM
jgi:Ca2+-transporting ATPase